MKIAASFAKPPMSWRIPAAVTWCCALALCVAAIAFAVSLAAMREGSPELELRVERGVKKLAQLPALQLPEPEETEALKRKIAAWNRLSGVKGWGTSQLLAWFEERTPKEIHFVSLQHEPKSGEVELIATSSSAAALTVFLRRLEDERAFAEVLLSKQGGRGAAAANEPLEFELQLKLAP